MDVELAGVVYRNPGEYGDFEWMIEQPEYADALFIFNDNEEQFLFHRRDPHPQFECMSGGGNAVIRPYQCEDPPRAAGVPTGSRGRGYASFDDHVRSVIDRAGDDIAALLETGRYRRVFYSSDVFGGLGTGIFSVGEEVKEYIVDKLREVITR